MATVGELRDPEAFDGEEYLRGERDYEIREWFRRFGVTPEFYVDGEPYYPTHVYLHAVRDENGNVVDYDELWVTVPYRTYDPYMYRCAALAPWREGGREREKV
jgi:hypothetical protein